MTDDSRGRLDLRSLDVTRDVVREDAIAHAIMARLSSGPEDIIGAWHRWHRALVAATVVFVLMAAASVLADPRSGPPPLAEVITGWARTDHVPPNGELLTAYRGYRP